MLSITRALVRTVRRHHWSGRHALILALGVLLAVGTIASTPAKAYAVPPAVSTPLHTGVDDSGPLAAFGSNVVFGTHRSANTGGTWTSDPTLSTTTWMMAVNGTLVGYRSTGTSVTAVVYTISTGVVTTPTLPATPTSMSGAWILWGSGVAYNAYNFLTSTGPSLMTPPAGTVTDLKPQLTATGSVLWSGTASTLHSVYAVAATPTSAPGAWVTVDAAGGVVVTTSSQLVYVLATTTTVQICGRPLLNLSTAPTCSTVMTGTYDSVYPLFYNFGPWTVVNIWTGLGPAGQYTSFLWNGTLSTSTKIQLPALSSIDQPPAAGMDAYGDTPYVLVRDSNTVPTILRVFQEGTVSAGFPIPPTAASSVGFLAVAPDRVVGADTRDGSLDLPAWTRSVSQSGFGLETLLPLRTSGLAASAARTAVSGPAGLSIYDRDLKKPRNTITDAHLDQLSGPYITRLGWNTAANGPEIEVATVNNTTVGKFLGTAGTLFGSEYVTWTTDTAPTGSAHVVVNDLTGISPPRTLTLPLGTAVCGAGRVWGDTLFMTCGAKAQAFSLKDGSLLKTYPAPQNQFVNVMDVGDGYAILTFNNFDYNLWDLSLGSLTPLTDCSYNVTSDGSGHVACASTTDLIWRDFSSLSKSAPRVLGALASPTADFSDAVAWSVEFDATKPLMAGTVDISKTGGAVVRTLKTLASTDGSIRGVTWDGMNDSGKPVPAGAYTYTLKAVAVDGSGTVMSSLSSVLPVDGPQPASGKITVTSANPAGMNPGAFLSVSPSRLLDTRLTGTPFGPAQTRSLKVTGVGGVPSTGVSAVVLNVTVTDTTSTGYLTVSPTGTPRPVVSNLNWSTGATIPNAVTVKVGTNGQVDLYQSGPGSANVIVDVAGYYVGGTVAAAGGFTALAPSRILDTRILGGKLASTESRELAILGQGGVPPSIVSAVVLNVTVTDTNAIGYLTVFPSGTPRPTASNLNWSAGMTVPNLVTVKVGANGKVTLFQSGPGTASLVVDVAGYFLGGTATQPGMFVAISPARVLDTRSTSPVAGLSDLALTILGKGGILAIGVSAVVINTTVTDTTMAGYLAVFPGTNPPPTASNLNWSGPNATVANLVTVQVGSDGSIKFHNGSPGRIQVIVDTAGYYIGT